MPTEVLRSDTFEQWRQKTNTISSDLGTKGDLSANIAANGSLVTAINELQSDIGVIGSLSTFAATNLVSALNELKTGNTVTISGTKTFSSSLNLSTGLDFTINGTSVLNATTLGSGVVNSSLTSVGTLGSGTWQANVISSTYGGTGVNNGGRTITLNTGNLTLIAQAAGSTVTVPASGTLATLAGIETLTNKTVNLISNSLTGTLAQFNTALSDDDFAGLATAQTLTNKTIALGSNSVSGTLSQFNTALTDDDFAALAAAQTLSNKSLTDASTFIIDDAAPTKRARFESSVITAGQTRVLTIQDKDGTIATTGDTMHIGTTSVTLSRGSGNLALAGISSVAFPGSTSGTITLLATATAGTNTLTMPATTGTIVTTGDTGSVTNTMLSGSIANNKLVNSAITVGTTSISLGGSSTTLAGLTSVTSTTFSGNLTGNVTGDLTGTATNATLAAAATKLATARAINGVNFDGTQAITVTAAAGTLTGATLNATVTGSSLTSVGTITTGVWNGSVIGTTYTQAKIISVSQGTGVTITEPTAGNLSIAIGQSVATTANPVFAGATLDNVRIGITNANTIDTSAGNLTLDSTGGTVSITDNVSITGTLGAGGAVTITGPNTETDVLTVKRTLVTSPVTFDDVFTVDSLGNVYVKGDLQVVGTTTINSTNISTEWEYILSKPDPVVTVTLTGDVTGSGNTTLTDLQSGTISFATTIAANSVALGADTTGNYVASISGDTESVVTGGTGEGSTPTLSIGSAIARRADATFIGTTSIALNRASAAQTLTGVSIDGNAATVTNGIYTTGTYSNPAWLTTLDQSKISSVSIAINAGTGISGGGTFNNLSGAVTITNSDRGSSQNIFKNIAVAGQSTVVADSNDDTVTLATDGSLVITTNATTDTITIVHADTSSQASVDNSNGLVIQDVTLDTYGHVTGLGSVDLDSRYVRLSPGGAQTIGGNLTISGDLTVNGTTTTVNSTTVEVADLNILLAKNATTAAAANGAGFTIGAITGGSPTMLYTNSSDRFVFNRGIEGSSIVRTGGTSSQFLKADGTIDSTSYLPSANAAASVANALTIGTGLGGVSYNGSSAVTITNTDKGSDQNIFKNVALSGTGTNSITCVADANNDTLTLSASSTSGISISADATTDTITFTNTGVTGITANLVPSGGSFGGAGTINFTGTANQVHLNSSGSTLTFSAPQNIHTAATPTFAGMTLSGLTGYVKANGASALTASSTIPSTDISNSTFVDLSTSQAASGVKTFNNAVLCKESLEIHNFNLVNGLWFMKSDSTYPYRVILTGNNISHLIGGTSVYTLLFQNNNGSLSLKANGTVEASSTVQATGFKTASGTSAQFLKADGSVDSTTYLSGTVAVANGGTGATTLTGYVKANGTTAFTASATIPYSALTDTPIIPAVYNSTVTISAGAGITVNSAASGTFTTNQTSASTLTIANSGVTSISGTTNQVTASASTGSVTLSLPQSISTVSSLQFGSLGIGTPASGATGEIRATDNITAYYTSDERLKTNVRPIENALDKVSQIDGVIYDWNDTYKKDHGDVDGYFVRPDNSGVIAQQVEKVFPNVVANRADGFKAVRYELLVPLLIEAIKDLKAEIEALKAQK